MKKNIKKAALILFLLFNIFCFAQKKYYKVEDKIYDEQKYNYQKKGMIESGNVKVEIVDSITRNDSIIHLVKLTRLDPFERHRKKIGTVFNIEKFRTEKGEKYSSSYLLGKPTLINFWFTRCSPCIKEIPTLNAIKEEFKNNVNFIAINFEDEEMENKFLEKHPFNFHHIFNAMKELDDLKINSFPMNLLLDKDGKIIAVFPMIEDDGKEIINSLNKLL